MLDELTHCVRYRRKSGDFDLGWHTMAAFDCESVAKLYCDDCAKNGLRDVEYRVFEVDKRS